MGIGGGWYEHEWRAYGYGFPAAKERLGRLREGVEIMHQAWTTGSATLDGTYYSGRRRPGLAETPAGERDPAVDCRRWREGDTADRRPLRAVHELRRRSRRHSPARASCCGGTARTSARTSMPSFGRRTSTRSSPRPRPRYSDVSTRSRPGSRRTSDRRRPPQFIGGVPQRQRSRRRHTRADRREAPRRSANSDWATPSTTSPRPRTTDPGIELFEREVIPAPVA